MAVPHGDLATRRRPSLAVPRNSLLAGRHVRPAPSWSRCLDVERRQFGAVQAVGMPSPNRSHFAAMEAVEDADPDHRPESAG